MSHRESMRNRIRETRSCGPIGSSDDAIDGLDDEYPRDDVQRYLEIAGGSVIRAQSKAASTRGEIGSRSTATRPTLCSTIGSVSGTALTSEIGPMTSRKYSGMTLTSPIRWTFAHRLITEFVSSRGIGAQLAERNARSMMRRFCMSGVRRHSGSFAASPHLTDDACASRWSPRTSRQYRSIYTASDRIPSIGSLSR